MYIYLDESGDLGFDNNKKGTSAFFVITLLVCHDAMSKRAFQVAVSKAIKNKLNRKKKSRKKQYELKGTNTTISIKEYFYNKLKSDSWDIYTVVFNKKKVYKEPLKAIGQNKIYNFLARFIIEKLPLAIVNNNVRLVVDKSKSRTEILEFNKYITTYIEGALPLHTSFSVEHLSSHDDPGLQAVDLFCWGIHRKYKDGNLEWYNVFSDKIKYENIYTH